MTSMTQRDGVWIGKWRDARWNWHTKRLGKVENTARIRLERLVVMAGELRHFPPKSVWVDLLKDYKGHMLYRGGGESYVRQTIAVLGRIIVEYGLADAHAFNMRVVQKYLAGLKERGRTAATLNLRIQQCKAFADWLVVVGEVDHGSKLASLKKVKPDAEPSRIRRVMQPEEEGVLMQDLFENPLQSRAGLPNRRRRLLYYVAITTGFRVSELATLTWNDFHSVEGSPAILRLRGSNTKNGKAVEQPIPESTRINLLAERARCQADCGEDLVGLDPDALIFDGWVKKRAGWMIRRDLEDSDLQSVTSDGVLDFHSLRHTFITRLVQTGVSAPYVQKLARHSDIAVTMKFYAHLTIIDLGRAVAKLDG